MNVGVQNRSQSPVQARSDQNNGTTHKTLSSNSYLGKLLKKSSTYRSSSLVSAGSKSPLASTPNSTRGLSSRGLNNTSSIDTSGRKLSTKASKRNSIHVRRDKSLSQITSRDRILSHEKSFSQMPCIARSRPIAAPQSARTGTPGRRECPENLHGCTKTGRTSNASIATVPRVTSSFSKSKSFSRASSRKPGISSSKLVHTKSQGSSRYPDSPMEEFSKSSSTLRSILTKNNRTSTSGRHFTPHSRVTVGSMMAPKAAVIPKIPQVDRDMHRKYEKMQQRRHESLEKNDGDTVGISTNSRFHKHGRRDVSKVGQRRGSRLSNNVDESVRQKKSLGNKRQSASSTWKGPMETVKLGEKSSNLLLQRKESNGPIVGNADNLETKNPRPLLADCCPPTQLRQKGSAKMITQILTRTCSPSPVNSPVQSDRGQPITSNPSAFDNGITMLDKNAEAFAPNGAESIVNNDFQNLPAENHCESINYSINDMVPSSQFPVCRKQFPNEAPLSGMGFTNNNINNMGVPMPSPLSNTLTNTGMPLALGATMVQVPNNMQAKTTVPSVGHQFPTNPSLQDLRLVYSNNKVPPFASPNNMVISGRASCVSASTNSTNAFSRLQGSPTVTMPVPSPASSTVPPQRASPFQSNFGGPLAPRVHPNQPQMRFMPPTPPNPPIQGKPKCCSCERGGRLPECRSPQARIAPGRTTKPANLGVQVLVILGSVPTRCACRGIDEIKKFSYHCCRHTYSFQSSLSRDGHSQWIRILRVFFTQISSILSVNFKCLLVYDYYGHYLSDFFESKCKF